MGLVQIGDMANYLITKTPLAGTTKEQMEAGTVCFKQFLKMITCLVFLFDLGCAYAHLNPITYYAPSAFVVVSALTSPSASYLIIT